MLGAIYGLSRAEEQRRVAELGEMLGATDLMDQPVRNLSLGQRMRCELAACLLHRPEILFLDEPTIGLDLVAKQRFRELLVRLNEQHGTTIFLTSHDVADIEHVAERAVVINHGEVIYDAEVNTMRRALLATKIVEVGLTGPIEVPRHDGVRLLEQTDQTMKLVVETVRTSIRTVLDDLLGPSVADISVVDPPLEQVIAEIYELPAAQADR
jgi:ABC-2 type transport system ATP-binding protein